MPDAADLSHMPGTTKGEDLEPDATETKGASDRPVGKVEGDLMVPNNSGSGTSDVD